MNGVDKHFVNYISSRLQGFSWKDQTVAWCRCPICGDSTKSRSKKRFYIYERDGRTYVYCHNCNYSTTFRSFLKTKFPEVFHQYQLSLFIPQEGVAEEKNEATPSLWDFSVCKKINELPKDHFVYRYVERRRIPFNKVLYCSDINKVLLDSDKVIKSIPTLVIPFYKRFQEPEVFQIRFFDPKITPKYLTFKASKDALKIYNYDFVNLNKSVYVTEGPIDSMMLNNAVAVSGSDLLFASSKIPKPVFIYDNEPRSRVICRKIWKVIKEGYHVVIFPDLPYKDLNDMLVKGNIDVEDLVKSNTYQGLNAELCFHAWRRCSI